MLTAVLDFVIPPSADRDMPGAGELGLAERVSGDLASRGAEELLRDGLGRLGASAKDAVGAAFAELPSDRRRTVIEEFEAAGGGLAGMLAFPTYIAYYEHPRVLTALGREPRPPHPVGYELEPLDAKRLDVVRARGKLYREC